MFKIQLTPRAKRRLKGISKEFKPAIKEIFDEIRDDPLVGKPLGKKLVNQFSYKFGVYRIIYRVNIQKRTIIILTAGHRSTIYN